MLIGSQVLRSCLATGAIKAWRNQERLNANQLKIGPNSIDVTLGDTILRSKPPDRGYIDPLDPQALSWENIGHDGEGRFVIYPGTIYLGYAAERFECSFHAAGDMLVQMIDGRSTVGRLGILVHVTAGFGDVGFEGNFTLEIVNLGSYPVILYAGMRIAQVSFQTVTGAGQYNGAYNEDHKDRPVPPLLGRDRFF